MSNNELKINDQINTREVRLIDSEGNMVGIVPIFKALGMAQELELDLVEISPNATPPVCKIADFGKILYQNQKQAVEAKKKQKVVELKELRMSINIGKTDLERKIKQSSEFLKEGNKVKFSFQFRGREISHVHLAEELIEKIINDLEEYGKIDSKPLLEGKRMSFIISPVTKKQK